MKLSISVHHLNLKNSSVTSAKDYEKIRMYGMCRFNSRPYEFIVLTWSHMIPIEPYLYVCLCIAKFPNYFVLSERYRNIKTWSSNSIDKKAKKIDKSEIINNYC